MRRSEVMWAAGSAALGAAAAALVGSAPPYRPVDALALGLPAASGLVLAWRHVAPLPVLAAASLLVVANAAAGFPVTVVQWPVWIALLTCFALLAGRRRVVAVALTLVGVAGWAVLDRGPLGAAQLFWVAMVVGIAIAGGDAVRSRRRRADAEQARVLAEERATLARELHDALGHAVNVMVVQAGVGRRVFAENPGFAREALGHIETVGRDALVELDRLLRVVHPDDDVRPLDLTGLARRVRAAGRDVRLTAGEVRLSASATRAAHRIVQEAVTNALRHTDSGRIDVQVAQVGDVVELEVANEAADLAAPTPGHGLVNMRERARLEGGSLEAGPVDGGFRVRAVLPAQPPP
jgi:signal transduction histidine kinase